MMSIYTEPGIYIDEFKLFDNAYIGLTREFYL